jgi:hypothetical protein
MPCCSSFKIKDVSTAQEITALWFFYRTGLKVVLFGLAIFGRNSPAQVFIRHCNGTVIGEVRFSLAISSNAAFFGKGGSSVSGIQVPKSSMMKPWYEPRKFPRHKHATYKIEQFGVDWPLWMFYSLADCIPGTPLFGNPELDSVVRMAYSSTSKRNDISLFSNALWVVSCLIDQQPLVCVKPLPYADNLSSRASAESKDSETGRVLRVGECVHSDLVLDPSVNQFVNQLSGDSRSNSIFVLKIADALLTQKHTWFYPISFYCVFVAYGVKERKDQSSLSTPTFHSELLLIPWPNVVRLLRAASPQTAALVENSLRSKGIDCSTVSDKFKPSVPSLAFADVVNGEEKESKIVASMSSTLRKMLRAPSRVEEALNEFSIFSLYSYQLHLLCGLPGMELLHLGQKRAWVTLKELLEDQNAPSQIAMAPLAFEEKIAGRDYRLDLDLFSSIYGITRRARALPRIRTGIERITTIQTLPVMPICISYSIARVLVQSRIVEENLLLAKLRSLLRGIKIERVLVFRPLANLDPVYIFLVQSLM